MAVKISQLNSASTLTGSEIIPLVQGGETKKTTVSDLLSGTGGLSGTNYIFVKADGTPVENAVSLQAAYSEATTLSPDADNRIVIVLAPGEYAFDGLFTMGTQYVDLVSLTGNRDVIFDRADILGDPFGLEPYYETVSSIGECLMVSADNVFVKGIKGKLRQSPNLDIVLGQGEDYILPIQIGDNLSGLVMENCEGGILSFGGDFTFGSNPIEVSGTFINCQGGDFSFGSTGDASGVFIKCQGGDNSFGFEGVSSGTFTDCQSGYESFGGDVSSGTFTNCQGGNNSFGGDATGTFINCQGGDFSFAGGDMNVSNASGTFTNCQGGERSFGGDATGTFTNCRASQQSFNGNVSGTFTNCQGGDQSFGGDGGISSGTFTNCQGGDNSFGGDATGTFTACQGGANSFGGDGGTLSGKLYFCRLRTGSFQTLTGEGLIRASVDGSDTFIDILPVI